MASSLLFGNVDASTVSKSRDSDDFQDEHHGGMNTDFFALPGLPSVGFEDTFAPSYDGKNERGSRQMCMFGSSNSEDCTRSNSIAPLQFFPLKRDMWVMPMLGLSAMNVLVILAFEIFVICKATGNSPSRRYGIIFQYEIIFHRERTTHFVQILVPKSYFS